jgi:hypothetical protein
MQRARITHKSQRLFSFFFSSSDTHEIELPHVLLPLLLLLQFPPFFLLLLSFQPKMDLITLRSLLIALVKAPGEEEDKPKKDSRPYG